MYAPKAPRHPHVITTHGDTREDPYFWLNERDRPEVLEYLNAENAYAESLLEPQRDLQKTIYEEIKGRMVQREESVPYFKNDYWY